MYWVYHVLQAQVELQLEENTRESEKMHALAMKEVQTKIEKVSRNGSNTH